MSVVFVTRLHKAVKNPEGQHPVVLQVTWDRKVRRKRLGIWVYEYQFEIDEDGNGVFRKGTHGREENTQIAKDAILKAKRIKRKHFSENPFSYAKFAELFTGKPIEAVTVLEFCETVIQGFLKRGQANSSNDYKVLASAIRKVAPNDLSFAEFTQDWLQDFEEHFTAKGTKCVTYMRHLRALFNKAVQKKVADFKANPFKNPYTNPYGYDIARLNKLKSGKVNPYRIKDLGREQLILLKNYTPVSKKEEEYLDMWWFSFYMFGVNLTDMAQIKRSHIKDNRWFYERSKTGTGLKKGKPILPEALALIKKYDTGGKYIFPILVRDYDTTPLKLANRIKDYAGYIYKMAKRVSERLEYDGYFSYYSARYSSATLALNEGADRNTVSHLLDHENFSTIDNYAGRADDSKVVKAMEILRLQ